MIDHTDDERSVAAMALISRTGFWTKRYLPNGSNWIMRVWASGTQDTPYNIQYAIQSTLHASDNAVRSDSEYDQKIWKLLVSQRLKMPICGFSWIGRLPRLQSWRTSTPLIDIGCLSSRPQGWSTFYPSIVDRAQWFSLYLTLWGFVEVFKGCIPITHHIRWYYCSATNMTLS